MENLIVWVCESHTEGPFGQRHSHISSVYRPGVGDKANRCYFCGDVVQPYSITKMETIGDSK